MDEEVINKLLEWSMEDYIDIFKENKIDIISFHLIDLEMIKELIKPIGDRVKFIQNLNLWRKEMTQDKGNANNPPVIPQNEDNMYVDVLSPRHRNIVLPDDFNIKSLDVPNAGESATEEYDLQTPSPCSFNISSDVPNARESATEVYGLQTTSPCSSGASNAAIVLTYSPCSPAPVKRQALLDLLNKSAKGRNLLKLHQNEGLLSNNSRRNICNIIVEDLLAEGPDARVSHKTLFDCVQEIINIFPKEKENTYYVPYVNKSNCKIKVKTCARGKLYDCLQNRKRVYREAEKKNTALKADQATQGIKHLQASNDKEDDDQLITWLRNSIEPWQMVETKWRESAPYRLECLSTSDKTIVQYMNEFPALKSPVGYSLLTEDFKTLYPGKENLFHENFPLYKEKILCYAKQKASRDELVKKTIQELEDTDTEDNDVRTAEVKTVIACMLLPLLLGNPLSKAKKTSWRPSKQEASEGFITRIATVGELQTTISSRRDKFLKLKLTLQPFIIIVGREYTAIERYYVIVNETHYVLHSMIDAVDACFKIYHALNCRYPIECASTWQFIQKGFYNLQTPYDKQFVSVNSLITDLEIN